MRYVVVLLGLVSVLAAAAFAVTSSADSAANGKIDARLLGQLSGAERVNVFVKMAADASLARAETITNRVERLNYVHTTLAAQAASSQRGVTAFLDGQGVRHRSFWINNSVYVYGADRALVDALADRSDVAYVRGDYEVPLIDAVSRTASSSAGPQAPEWGLTMIKAPDVWALGNRGEGIVVANIDTGVRWTHDAIDGQYRGANGNHNYDWWDPDQTLPVPTDPHSHGTHTMGTMVGDDGGANQIGVAPNAKWIAAQGCDSGFCGDFDLISSAEWIACPTKVDGSDPDCSQAPHVVNNSWYSDGGYDWYQSYVDAWRDAGIIPVFAIGNAGPECRTSGSPGDYANVLGVGALTSTGVLATFSSKGPGDFEEKIKPDLVAPGADVRSSVNSSDTAYANFSGTSMATPHVAGTIALLLNDTPGATYEQLASVLKATAKQGLPDPPDPDKCGNYGKKNYPNTLYGYGRVHALKAVKNLP